MKVSTSGLRQDSPARPLLLGLLSYQGVTDAAGAASGLTIVCGDLVNEPSYDGQLLKVRSGPAAGQVKPIYVQAGNTLTFATPWTNAAGAVVQIVAGTLFDILSISGGGGGPGPAPREGLSYYGVVDAVPGANQFTIGSLAGLGAGKFDGATNPYYAFVLRDAGGAGAAPQGEQLPITAYVTATGVFTTGAFTAAVAVGDEILILHPNVAAVLVILAGLAVPGVDSVINLLMRDVTGNKADTALYAATVTDSLMRYLKAVLHTEVLAIGTFTTSSATVPADTGRTEANDAWKGCLLMPLVAGAGATAFQPKRIVSFANVGGVFTIDPGNPFTSPTGLVAYAILPAQADFVPAADSARNVSTPEVVGNKADAAVTVVGVVASAIAYTKGILNVIAAINSGFQEQADVAVNINAILAAETDVLNVAVAGTRYIVRSLRLKCADPGANTVTVRLYELVNDGAIAVQSFDITGANFGTYLSLMDMFGLPYLAGDNLRVTVQASAAGPYAVTGQYSHATAT